MKTRTCPSFKPTLTKKETTMTILFFSDNYTNVQYVGIELNHLREVMNAFTTKKFPALQQARLFPNICLNAKGDGLSLPEGLVWEDDLDYLEELARYRYQAYNAASGDVYAASPKLVHVKSWWRKLSIAEQLEVEENLVIIKIDHEPAYGDRCSLDVSDLFMNIMEYED